MRHRQPYLSIGDNPMLSAFSDEQKQHMRQLRARNRDALREVAGVSGVYDLTRPLDNESRVSDVTGESRNKGKGKANISSTSTSGGTQTYQFAHERWNGLDNGRGEAGTWA